MRGVSTPTHEYARVAAMQVHSLSIHPNHRDPSLAETVSALTASTRAYTRVVLRLRAQAEKEATLQTSGSQTTPPTAHKSFNFSPGRAGTSSRVSSRAPSPTMSNYSQSQPPTNTPGAIQSATSQASASFRSPLFSLRRAPLLRAFVPSPEGDWLSDKSVLECEAECKRAGIAHLLRLGDVVWDVAVGDEGNIGRLIWDGSYLIVSLTVAGKVFHAPAISQRKLTSAHRIWIIRIRLSGIFLSIFLPWHSHPRTSIGLYALGLTLVTRLSTLT